MLRNLNLKRRFSIGLVFIFIVAMMNFPVISTATTPTNVAGDKDVTSTTPKSTTYAATYANDTGTNATNTSWESLNEPTTTAKQWWKVNLGNVYTISTIKLLTSSNGSKYFNYTIYGSYNGTNWTPIVEKNDSTIAPSTPVVFNMTAYNVQFLKVEFTKNSANAGADIKDFQAWGVAETCNGLGIGGTLVEVRTDNVVKDSSGNTVSGLTRTKIVRGYPDGTIAYYSDGSVNNYASQTGPWEVNVLTANSNYAGQVLGRLCGGRVNSTQYVWTEAQSENAYAAVNGSYFVLPSSQGGYGSEGASMSIAAANGQITNETVSPRSGIFIPYGNMTDILIGRFTNQSKRIYSSDGTSVYLNGINRKLGVKMGVTAGYIPSHDTICHNYDSPNTNLDVVDPNMGNEIVLYTDKFPKIGSTSTTELTNDAGSTDIAEVVIDISSFGMDGGITSGVVESGSNSHGTTIAPGHAVLAGIGTGAQWIRNHAYVGKTITVRYEVNLDTTVNAANPTGIVFRNNTSILSAGPCLMLDGTATSPTYWQQEGFDQNTIQGEKFIGRNPRTLVGTTGIQRVNGTGSLMLVVVDGRNTNYSVGATFNEAATIMQSLGARNVLNLDGGRSSAMYVSGTNTNTVNRLLDPANPRPVGDILELRP